MADEDIPPDEIQSRPQGRDAALINALAIIALVAYAFFSGKRVEPGKTAEMLTIRAISFTALGVLWSWSMHLTFRAAHDDEWAPVVLISGFFELLVIIAMVTN